MWSGFLLFWLVKVDFLSNFGGFVWSYGELMVNLCFIWLIFSRFQLDFSEIGFPVFLLICLSSAMWTKLGVWWIWTIYYFQFKIFFFWLISSVNDSDCGFVCLLYALIFSLFFLGFSWGFFGFPGFVVVFIHYRLGRAWLFFIQEVIV